MINRSSSLRFIDPTLGFRSTTYAPTMYLICIIDRDNNRTMNSVVICTYNLNYTIASHGSFLVHISNHPFLGPYQQLSNWSDCFSCLSFASVTPVNPREVTPHPLTHHLGTIHGEHLGYNDMLSCKGAEDAVIYLRQWCCTHTSHHNNESGTNTTLFAGCFPLVLTFVVVV